MKRFTSGPLTIREVTSQTWSDFDRLFESKGAPGYCWCMAWRASATEIRNASKANRKQQIAGRIRSKTPVGILGYLDGEPVAWCSVGPRSTFRGLVKGDGPDDGIWSITCFFVLRRHRKTGLARAMLAAAIRHAKAKGARVVQGYPVTPDSPSYRHMGFVSMFESMGFSQCGREGKRRRVMELSVEP
jgi:GNAT superfamily N-acetyltransferase